MNPLAVTVNMGLLIRRQCRQYLEREQFAGKCQFIEQRHLLDSDFMIRGEHNEVCRIVGVIQSVDEQRHRSNRSSGA